MTGQHDSHDLWQRAAAFAARAHRHQIRKDGRTPYVSHPYRVAMTIRHVFECDDAVVIAAAMLHDTIEDCGVDYDDVLDAFGEQVADLVALMTKDMRLVEAERERAYDDQLLHGPWQAKMLKLADVYDNLTDAVEGRRPMDGMLKKAKRAVLLAEGVPELDHARAIVEDLIRHHDAR